MLNSNIYLDFLFLLLIIISLFQKKKSADVQMVWVTIAIGAVSLASKYLIPLFKRRQWMASGYELGSAYRRNVLGENMATTDKQKIVGDEAVYMARNILTAGFGIPVTRWGWYMEYILPGRYDAYVADSKKTYGGWFPTPAQFERAHFLAKTYFPNQPPPPKFRWDLRNFDLVPYVAPIPDPDNPKKPMNVTLDGILYVSDGKIVNPNPDVVSVIQSKERVQEAEAQATEGNNTLTYGLLAAAAVGGYYYFTKNKRK